MKTMKISQIVSRLALLSVVCIAGTAAAEERRDALILGDSVAFSYIASVGFEYFYTNPDNFIGFANRLGFMFDLNVVNAACPGETTGSFLSATAPDNGCRAYRGAFPLHVDYKSTQLAFTTAYLRTHRDVRLVTLTLGANDGFLLEEACGANPANSTPDLVNACIAAGAPQLLATVAGNIQKILADLRGTGYRGAIVVTNYYSLDYSDAAGTALTADLNAAIAAPTQAYGAVVADVFTAFKTVAAKTAFGGMTCKTGLLNPNVTSQAACDVHPAQTGHRIIADAVAHTFAAEERY
jgi:lysophospholipase L1-like esterase